MGKFSCVLGSSISILLFCWSISLGVGSKCFSNSADASRELRSAVPFVSIALFVPLDCGGGVLSGIAHLRNASN